MVDPVQIRPSDLQIGQPEGALLTYWPAPIMCMAPGARGIHGRMIRNEDGTFGLDRLVTGLPVPPASFPTSDSALEWMADQINALLRARASTGRSNSGLIIEPGSDDAKLAFIHQALLRAMAEKGYRWRPIENGLEIVRPEGDVALTVRDHRPAMVEAARVQAREYMGEPIAEEVER